MADTEDFIAGLVIFVIAMVVIVLSTIYSGFVLSILWAWFMVKTFALPALTISQALGVSIVVRFLTWEYPTNKDEKASDSVPVSLVKVFAIPPLALIFGYIVPLFM